MSVIMQLSISGDEHSERTGAYVDGYMSAGTAYVVDKRGSGSYAYKIEKDGQTSGIRSAEDLGFETFETIVSADEGVAVVASKDDRYRIILLGDSFESVRYSPLFTLPSGKKFSSLSQEAGIWYISAVGSDGRAAFVYSMDDDQFSEASTEERKTEKDGDSRDNRVLDLSSIYEQRAPEGAFYSKAAFAGNVLFIQADSEEPAGIFAIDEDAKSSYISANIDIIWRNRMFKQKAVVFLAFIMAGVLMFVLNMALRRRSPFFARSISVIIASAMVLSALGLAAAYGINYRIGQQTFNMLSEVLDTLETGVDRSGLLPEDTEEFFENDEYYKLRDCMDSPLADVLLVDLNDGRIILSRSGECRMQVSDLYGQDVYEVYRQASANGTGQGMARVAGTDYTVCAASMYKDFNRRVAIIGLYEAKKVDIKSMLDIWTVLLGVFLLILIYVIYRNAVSHSKLKALSDSMIDVSRGSGDVVVIPERKSAELIRHWDALGEIASVFRRMNYDAYQTYEAYFRFAPKKIETFLEKSSIAEVRCGDLAMFSGTEAILTLSGDMMSSVSGIDDMNDLIMIMEKHQEKRDGVLISNDMSSGIVKLVFKDEKDILSFGIDFWNDAEALWPEGRVGAGMVLHYGVFRYGVIGTVRQSMVFLDSAESTLIEKYSGWLKNMGLGLIVTDSMIRHEGISEEDKRRGLRYIGFVEEKGVRLDLYEVLDANTASVRSAKKAGLARYNEALEHFKAHDFYIARNVFSEILKDNPEDAIVKWYLFESERYLNQAPRGDVLRIDRRRR